jgi:LPXTG-motif cell wall-anchored protein
MKHLLIIILVLFTVIPAEAQCAMCRAVIESEEGGELATGINNGILYLMVFPYLLVGGIGYVVYRSRKNAKTP